MSSLVENYPDPVQLLVDLRLGGLIDELRDAIRREVGTDRVPLDVHGAGNPNARGAKMPPASGENPTSAGVP